MISVGQVKIASLEMLRGFEIISHLIKKYGLIYQNYFLGVSYNQNQISIRNSGTGPKASLNSLQSFSFLFIIDPITIFLSVA